MNRSEYMMEFFKERFEIESTIAKVEPDDYDRYHFAVEERYDTVCFYVTFCKSDSAMDQLELEDYLSACADNLIVQPLYDEEDDEPLLQHLLYDYVKGCSIFYDLKKESCMVINPNGDKWYLKRSSYNNLWDSVAEYQVEELIELYVSNQEGRKQTDPIVFLMVEGTTYPKVDKVKNAVIHGGCSKGNYQIIRTLIEGDSLFFEIMALGNDRYESFNSRYYRDETGNIQEDRTEHTSNTNDPMRVSLLKKSSFALSPLLTEEEKEFLNSIPRETSRPEYAGDKFYVALGRMEKNYYINIGYWLGITKETLDNVKFSPEIENEINLWKNLSGD